MNKIQIQGLCSVNDAKYRINGILEANLDHSNKICVEHQNSYILFNADLYTVAETSKTSNENPTHLMYFITSSPLYLTHRQKEFLQNTLNFKFQEL